MDEARELNKLIISGDQNSSKKSKKLPIIIGIIAIIVAVGIIAAVLFFTTRDPNFEKIEDEYKQKGITYTYEDYTKDKQVAEQQTEAGQAADSKQMSDAYQQAKKKNDKILKNMSVDTGVSIDQDGIIQTILSKSQETCDYIDNDFGWPTSKYGDEFNAAREYTRQLDKYACYKTSMSNSYEGFKTLDEQADCLRYSTYLAIPYSITNTPSELYRGIYTNYFNAGHPRITNINGMTLEEAPNADKINNQMYNLVVTASTNAGMFKVFMISSVTDKGVGSYTVVDYKIM